MVQVASGQPDGSIAAESATDTHDRTKAFVRVSTMCALATIPAWLFWLVVLSDNFFSSTSVRVFALVSIALATSIGLIPSAHILAGWLGRSGPNWTPVAAGLVAVFGAGAVVSVLLNGGFATEGLETFIAIAVASNGGAAIYQFSRVASPPSPAGERLRESALQVIEHPIALESGEQETSARMGPGETGTAVSGERHVSARAEVGRQDIAEGFRGYADRNETAARLFLILGVVVFAASAGAALWLVEGLGSSASATAILTRAAITLPGAAVFAVFVRESAARRRYSAWGGLIAIQAEHIGAFVADLPSSGREEVELQFARSVFRGGDVALEQRNATRSSRLGRPKAAAPGDVDATVALAQETINLATSSAETILKLAKTTTEAT